MYIPNHVFYEALKKHMNYGFFSPVHTPINWIIPPKKGHLALVITNDQKGKIFKVNNVVRNEDGYYSYHLSDVNSNNCIIASGMDVERPKILFIRK